ncbi:MAG: alpha/beta hydrolase [Aggregatilineales bacterium]
MRQLYRNFSHLAVICMVALFVLPLTGLTLKHQAEPTKSGAVPALPLAACHLDVGVGDVKRPIDAQCGTLTVPEDYAHPQGGTLTLHFMILPPLKPNASGLPIFHLEGGPGGSAITNFGQAWFAAYDPLRQDHPVVLIDQRGTGQSSSLQCTEFSAAALDDLAQITTSQADQNLSNKRLAACLVRLSKTTDPQFYTSNALADDTDAVRAALGYDQIELFGNSYGTSLGQIYLKRHGDHVAGLVLDSVTAPWNHWTLDAANNGQAAFDKLLALCKADADCNKAFPDLPGDLQTALKKLQDKPVTIMALSALTAAPHTVGMTADRLREALYQLLYNSANSTILPSAIHAAAQGDYTLPAGILIAEAEQADQVSRGLYESVVCSEIVPFITPDLIKQYVHDNLFSPLEPPDSYASDCKAWRSAELSVGDVAPFTSDRPVLILSGDLDPITPVKYGQETHARLSHSTLAIFPYEAHGVLPNSKCAQNVVVAFLNAPTQPLDTSCTANDLKPLFVGAYQVKLTPFSTPNATFTGVAPQGWTPEQVGPLTFFTSPDGKQFAAAGVFKNQTVQQAQQAVSDTLTHRYGALEVEQTQTVNILFVSITIVAHSLDRPDQAYTGTFILRAQGADTFVAWQAAPTAWFQAASAAVVSQMLVAMQAR